MGNGHTTIDPNLLLAQTGWVRSLAQHLVRDPSSAEDVAQDTLLAALESPPRDAGDAQRLRAWLGRVTYNLAHLAMRRRTRRRTREERVARSERLVSAADTVARASLTQTVVDAVMKLDDPYRSTVFLRYFEGLSTADIALETGVSDNAVRKRLFRARERLRGLLDAAHHGDRQSWFHGLAPIAGLALPSGGEVTVAKSSGGLGALKSVAASPLAALLTGGALLGALAFFAQGERPRSDPAAPEVALRSERRTVELSAWRTPVPTAPATTSGELDERRIEAPQVIVDPLEREVPSTESPPRTPETGALPVHGRVFDLDQHALAGLEIIAQARPDVVLATTAADGTFRLELTAAAATLDVRSDAFATLRAAHVDGRNHAHEQVLVVAPAVRVTGAVLDPFDLPVANARVEVGVREWALLGIDRTLDLSAHLPHQVRTDADGRFTLVRAPTAAGLFLRTEHERFLSDERPMPAWDSDVVVTLEARPPPAFVVHGVVLFEDHTPASDVEVRLEAATATTDLLGAFQLHLALPPASGAALTASKDGFVSTILPDIGTYLAQTDGSDAHIALTLGQPAAELAGHVVDEDAEPVSDLTVYAVPLPSSPSGNQEAMDWLATFASQNTGDDGSFAFSGLAGGDYLLLVVSGDELVANGHAAVRTGYDADVELRVNATATAQAMPAPAPALSLRVAGAAGFETASVLDPTGTELMLHGPLGSTVNALLFAGDSVVFRIEGEAAALVLQGPDGATSVVPLTLVPGELARIQP